MNQPTHQAGVGLIGVAGEDPLGTLTGGRRAVETELAVSELTSSAAIIGELHQPHELGTGGGIVVQADPHICEIAPGLDECGIDRESLFKGLGCVFELAALQQHDAQVGPGLVEVLVELDRCPQVIFGGREVPATQHYQAQVRVWLREARVQFEGQPKPGLGVVQATLGQFLHTAGVQRDGPWR